MTSSFAVDTLSVKDTLLALAAHAPCLAGTAPEVYVTGLLDSSVQYTLRLWVSEADYWPTRYALTEAVKREFDAAGISIPYPQMDVHLTK